MQAFCWIQGSPLRMCCNLTAASLMVRPFLPVAAADEAIPLCLASLSVALPATLLDSRLSPSMCHRQCVTATEPSSQLMSAPKKSSSIAAPEASRLLSTISALPGCKRNTYVGRVWTAETCTIGTLSSAIEHDQLAEGRLSGRCTNNGANFQSSVFPTIILVLCPWLRVQQAGILSSIFGEFFVKLHSAKAVTPCRAPSL